MNAVIRWYLQWRCLIPALGLALTLTVFGQSGVENGFAWQQTGSGVAMIVGYSCGNGAVEIPSTIGGLSTTSIGGAAFQNCTGLTSVIIPNSVTDIGDDAFYGCIGLTDVTIPSSVTRIGNSAFYQCSGLREITLPDSVTTIGNNAFDSCTGLTLVTLPNSLTDIGDGAFEYSSGLTNVIFGNAVARIGANAFYWTGLTSVILPGSLGNLGDGAFGGCFALTGISVDDTNPFFSAIDGTLFDKGQTTLIQYPPARPGTTYDIPAGVTSLGTGSFQYAVNLTSVTIPPSVTQIGDFAFYGCSALTTTALPASLKHLGSEAFDSCAGLTAILVNNGNPFFTSVDGVLFDKGLTKLLQYPPSKADTSYKLPGTVTSIGDYAVVGGSHLTDITLPNGLTSIGINAFSSCTGLTSLTFPSSISSISSGAFQQCSNLTHVCFEGDAPADGGWIFSGTRVASICILGGSSGWGPTFSGVNTILCSQCVSAAVLGRYVFYNASAWDGNDAGANAKDDLAIATDKTALLPGNMATFANYTSYSRGINGVMIDLAPGGSSDGISAADFEFRVGNDNNPAAWPAAPAPLVVALRPGSGNNGSDRVTIIWGNNVIQKQWLRIAVLPTAKTGLTSPDVFFLGNAIGDTGNSPTDTKVTAVDLLRVRGNYAALLGSAHVDNPYDFNRDGKVNAQDLLLVRNNYSSIATALQLINLTGL
jgi:BspA type Leucine rich repeat region (6 copies)/Dockerin type I domain